MIKRPAQADETTLGNAIGYFTKLVESTTGGQLTIMTVVKDAVRDGNS